MWSSLRTRGGGPMGEKNSLGQGMACAWEAFHVCLLECLSLEQIALLRVFWKCLVFWMYQIFLLLFKENLFHELVISPSLMVLLLLQWFPFILQGFIVFSPSADCSAIAAQQRCLFFSLLFPSPFISASRASTNQRKSIVYFLIQCLLIKGIV